MEGEEVSVLPPGLRGVPPEHTKVTQLTLAFPSMGQPALGHSWSHRVGAAAFRGARRGGAGAHAEAAWGLGGGWAAQDFHAVSFGTLCVCLLS